MYFMPYLSASIYGILKIQNRNSCVLSSCDILAAFKVHIEFCKYL